MTRPGWVPDGVDIHRPSIARVYDYALGGSHNVKADRDAGDRVLSEFPGGRLMAYANRGFLFTRDVPRTGHFGTGDLEIRIRDGGMLGRADVLLRRSYDIN